MAKQLKELTIEEQLVKARRERATYNDTLTVLTQLKEQLPEVWTIAEVVGKWVWVTFPMKPEKTVLESSKTWVSIGIKIEGLGNMLVGILDYTQKAIRTFIIQSTRQKT